VLALGSSASIFGRTPRPRCAKTRDINVTHVARPSPELRPSTILVVEDEILNRLWIGPELRTAGFIVIEAANADEALAVFNAGQQIDLLMTDVRMPGSMDGVKLATRVRSTWPTVKILNCFRPRFRSTCRMCRCVS
jgi:PleD family two-component response regulator